MQYYHYLYIVHKDYNLNGLAFVKHFGRDKTIQLQKTAAGLEACVQQSFCCNESDLARSWMYYKNGHNLCYQQLQTTDTL